MSLNIPHRILFVLHLPPPVHGAAMMGKYIQDSQIVNNTFDCYYINLSMASSIDDVGKFRIMKFFSLYEQLRKIVRTVKAFHPDLVYITPNAKGTAFFKEWIIVEILKIMGCKVVAHYHNKGVSSVQNRIPYKWLYHIFFKNLKVILLADCLYDDIKKFVKREDVYICPNGINDNQQEEMIVDVKNRNILFLSNLIESKGVIDLLDACKILKDRGCDFSCTVVGAESEVISNAVFWECVKKRGLQRHIQYVGPKFGNEKESYFRQSGIMVFPTYYPKECFPLVLLEAMSYYLPCISTNEGAISEIIDDGQTGYIVSKKDPEQLSKRIRELIDNQELRLKMGREAHDKFKRFYTIDKFEYRIKEILEAILANE